MSRKTLGFVLAPLLGLSAMVLPVLLRAGGPLHDAPLFPLLRTAVERVGLPQLVLLFTTGVVLGLLSTAPALLLGLAAVSLLPLAAIAEMIKDPTSHNLFPFEFMMYALYGLVVVGGVVLVRRLRRRPSTSRPAGSDR
jgi:hypothetical protein